LNKKAGVNATNVYIIYPYPGTEINIKYNINIYDNNGEIIPVSKAASFALSNMKPKEVEGLLRTFELYVRVPEDKWEQVRKGEGEDNASLEMRKSIEKYILGVSA
jgi:hypothetical protein